MRLSVNGAVSAGGGIPGADGDAAGVLVVPRGVVAAFAGIDGGGVRHGRPVLDADVKRPLLGFVDG